MSCPKSVVYNFFKEQLFLNDGKWHQLSQLLTHSNWSVDTFIDELSTLPVEFELSEGSIRLTRSFYPLDESFLETAVSAGDKALRFHVYQGISSTSDYLKSYHSPVAGVDVCLCETQLKGRGRFGRRWHSPFGENVYCSIKWPLDSMLPAVSTLSLALGIALVDALKTSLGVSNSVGLKWPNDILVNGQKVCGLLLEMSLEQQNCHDLVIGFGLNVNMRQADLTNHWSSLTLVTGDYFNRNVLLVTVLNTLLETIEKHLNGDFSIMNRWKKYDLLYNKRVTVSSEGQRLTGVALGINQDGSLQLLLPSGEMKTCYAGITSLHKE